MRDLAPLYAQFPVNIAPPTDDSPFFFHNLRLRDVLRRRVWTGRFGGSAANIQAVWVLACCC